MKKCSCCQAEIENGQKFCPKCGAVLKKKKHASKVLIALIIIAMLGGAGVWSFRFLSEKNKVDTVTEAEKKADVEMAISENAEVETANDGNVLTDENQEVQNEEQEENVMKEETLDDLLANVELNDISLVMGETYDFGIDSSEINVTSSDENVAITDGSVIKGISPGTVEVHFSFNNDEKVLKVTIEQFKDNTVALGYSKSVPLHDNMPELEWSSSDSNIITVDDGVMTAINEGMVEITAQNGDQIYSFTTVVTLPTLSYDGEISELIGSEKTVEVYGTNGKIEWKSENEAIATVVDGTIHAEPSGAGQHTVVHAYVDGMDLSIPVNVEPLPQLYNLYNIYGYENDDDYGDAKISLLGKVSEIVTYGSGSQYPEVKSVGNLSAMDDDTIPVFRTFKSAGTYAGVRDEYTRLDVFLLGTSREANVVVEKFGKKYLGMDEKYAEITAGEQIGSCYAVYEAGEDYGVIHIYDYDMDQYLVTISLDDYEIQFAIYPMENAVRKTDARFSYANVDDISNDFAVNECTLGTNKILQRQREEYEMLKKQGTPLAIASRWLKGIGSAFVEAAQDEAIKTIAGVVVKTILL